MSDSNLAVIINISVASAALVCSVLTLFVILGMGKWNPYLKLITFLTICQALYEISFIMVYSTNNVEYFIYVALRGIFGLASTFWTNVLAITVCYTVVYLKSFNLRDRFPFIIFAVMIPSVLVILVGMFSTGETQQITLLIYYYLRVASIAFNILIYSLINWELYNRKHEWDRLTKDPVEELVKRLQYYPVVQVLTRVFPTWNEFQYGVLNYNYNTNLPIDQQTAVLGMAITEPCAGIFFFIIFLSVSPGSFALLRKQIRNILLKFPSCCFSQDKASRTIDMYASEGGEGTGNISTNPFNDSINIIGISSFSDNTSLRTSVLSLGISGDRKDVRQMDEYELVKEIERLYHYDSTTL